MSFYFIRHGRTLFNTQHKVQGWCDSPLVEEGVEAVRAIGSKLAGVEFVRAYASDKGRTCQTLAELLDARAVARGKRAQIDETPSAATYGERPSTAAAQTAGDPVGNPSPSTPGAARWLSALDEALATGTAVAQAGLPLRTDARLREWCYGDLEMHLGEELHQRLVEGFGEELSFAEENVRLPETADNLARLDRSGRAERFADVETRLRSFLQNVGDDTLACGGGNVLAVTHAFTIRTIMYLLDRSRINDPLVIVNGSLTRVDYDGERFALRETGVLEPA